MATICCYYKIQTRIVIRDAFPGDLCSSGPLEVRSIIEDEREGDEEMGEKSAATRVFVTKWNGF